MTVALLDGDIVAYRAAAAALREGFEWGDGDRSDLPDPEEAAKWAIATAHAWTRMAGCSKAIVCLTGRANFRKRVLPTYKQNRAGLVKPPAFHHVVRRLSESFPTQLVEGLEADDLLGILATTLPKFAGAVVVSIDKDMRSFPGNHLNPLKETKVVTVTPDEADLWWLMQTLTGDSVDGYAGLPNVGAKRAQAILGMTPRPAVDLWPLVAKAFVAKKLSEADAITQARVARILRREDYDQNTKEIILWHPTTPLRIPLVEAP